MISLLRKVSLFATLTDEQLHKVEGVSQVKTYKAGTVLFREKQPGDVVYLVVSGTVKIFTSKAGEEDKILSVLGSGASFGEQSLLDGGLRSASAQVVEDSRLASIHSQAFENLLREHFDISLHIIRLLSQRLRDTNQQVHDLTYMDARQRVILCLVRLVPSNGKRQGSTVIIKMNLSYDELCQMANVPKTQLLEVFRELQLKQILKISNDNYILDLSKLSQR